MLFLIPTGNYDKGLGVGKGLVQSSPLAPKKYRSLQDQHRNFPYGGFLLKYSFGERFELGGEVFSHEGYATPQTEASTMIDFGGYYHFKHHPGEQFLFCYGHSVAGQTERYAYIGM
ncbi:MAG TPA: hypothetical protein VF283_15570 [Bryobacteraceae bacterium]